VDKRSGVARAVNYDPAKRPRRQDWDGELIENGAFYFTTKEVMEREECRLGGRVALHEMEEHTFAELDSPTDWQIVANMAMIHGFWPPGSVKPEGTDESPGSAEVTILGDSKLGLAAAAGLGMGVGLGVAGVAALLAAAAAGLLRSKAAA